MVYSDELCIDMLLIVFFRSIKNQALAVLNCHCAISYVHRQHHVGILALKCALMLSLRIHVHNSVRLNLFVVIRVIHCILAPSYTPSVRNAVILYVHMATAQNHVKIFAIHVLIPAKMAASILNARKFVERIVIPLDVLNLVVVKEVPVVIFVLVSVTLTVEVFLVAIVIQPSLYSIRIARRNH